MPGNNSSVWVEVVWVALLRTGGWWWAASGAIGRVGGKRERETGKVGMWGFSTLIPASWRVKTDGSYLRS